MFILFVLLVVVEAKINWQIIDNEGIFDNKNLQKLLANLDTFDNELIIEIISKGLTTNELNTYSKMQFNGENYIVVDAKSMRIGLYPESGINYSQAAIILPLLFPELPSELIL